MAPKKTNDPFTPDERMVLLATGALCIAKAFLEAEAPLLTAAGKLAAPELLRLGQATMKNFNSLMENADARDSLPRLRGAVKKAKKKVMDRM
jgi:hypothetical protein